MKNVVAAACLSASLSVAAPAAAGPPDEPRAEYPKAIVSRATTLTKALAHRIQLNEGQYLQVKKLHLRLLHERAAIEHDSATAAAPELRDEAMANAQRRYEYDLNELLKPGQRLAYQQLRASFTAHRLR